MDTKEFVARRRVARRVAIAIAVALMVIVAHQSITRASVSRLATKVAPAGSHMGAIDYLESAVRPGMSPEEVHRTVHGYKSRHYFVTPIAGTRDSAVIERYTFALPLRDLLFDVDYRSGRVFWATTESYGTNHTRMLSEEEAMRLLRADYKALPTAP